MKISFAKVMGACFGVNDAVEMAINHPEAKNLTILGELVHNPQTVSRLKKKGVRLVGSIDDIDQIETQHVMITAHGASDRVKEAVKNKGFDLDDATCPLVHHAHRTIKKMVVKGFFPIVIGEEHHVETRGIVGDLDKFLVIQNSQQVESLSAADKKRLGIISQTTQNVGFVNRIVDEIEKMPGVEEVSFYNTICKPTRDRQKAVEELSEVVDIMIVVGGKNSSNTHKLKVLCDNKGIDAYHIESAAELKKSWFAGKDHAGITAGTSTPAFVIEEVGEGIQALCD